MSNEFKRGDRVITPRGVGHFIQREGKQHALVDLGLAEQGDRLFRLGDVKSFDGATGSTTYTVTVTVANRSGEVTLTWYRGASLPEAMAAMAQAAVQDIADTDMPESVRTYLRSVTLSFEEN